jgi:hypothetical protein
MSQRSILSGAHLGGVVEPSDRSEKSMDKRVLKFAPVRRWDELKSVEERQRGLNAPQIHRPGYYTLLSI